jgi:hypothetical protein
LATATAFVTLEPQNGEFADDVSERYRAFTGHESETPPSCLCRPTGEPINEAPKHEPPTFLMSSTHLVIRNIRMGESNDGLLSFRVESERYDRLQPSGCF